MAGMKRFVTYIYAYEEGKKGNNIGFAKVEIRGAELRMEIHMRGVYAVQTDCTVYLFREASGDMEGVQIGEMRLVNGAGDFGVVLNAVQIKDTPFGVGDMDGIFLRTGDDRIFMSRWKEGAALTVDLAHFREWRPAGEAQLESVQTPRQPAGEAQLESVQTPRQPRERHPGIDVPSRTTGQNMTGEQERERSAGEQEREGSAGMQEREGSAGMWERESGAGEQKREGSAGMWEKEGSAGAREQEASLREKKDENVQATEIPARNFFPDYSWEEIWEKLCVEHPVLAPLEDRDARCIQIELKDLKELPQRYWYLGNNSFLLHGFFNYRYLVVGRTGEERWFLGVPGVYQRQERVMAAIFGFPEFLAAASPEAGGEMPEHEPVNRFGCWCRYIEE